MHLEQKPLLIGFVALFALICVAIVWGYVNDSRNFFASGTRPKEAEVKVVKPRLPPLRQIDPMEGSKDEKAVVIAEFADFTCLYCRSMQNELQKILETNRGQVRIVWRDLPVAHDKTSNGLLAALAGRCAGDQGRFWEMHDRLFTSERFDIESLKKYARAIGLRAAAFDECLMQGKHIQAIQSDVQAAKSHGITGAPTFFIGDFFLSGYVTAEELQVAVRRAQIKMK